MFIALYEFRAKPGRDEDLQSAWARLTDAIYRVRGSLGSRLHRTENPSVYVAYAQWPSREVFERQVDPSSFTPAENAARAALADAAEAIITVYSMDVLDDRLQSKPAG